MDETMGALRILHLEDSPKDAEIVRERLADLDSPFELDWAPDRGAYEDYLATGRYGLILADYNLPGYDALAALEGAKAACPDVPFICVSGAIGEEKAVELLRRGSTDYVLKERLEKLPLVIRRALGEVEDRKARRTAEEALAESEAKLSRIISNSSAMICEIDEDGRFTFASESYEEALGYAPADLQGRSVAALFHPDDLEKAGSRHAEVKRDLETSIDEWRIKDKFGRYHVFECRGKTYKSKSGAIRTVVVSQDVTERRRAERELENQKNLLDSVIESAKEVIFAKDLDGRYCAISETGARVLGHSRAEVLGKADAEFLPAAMADEFRAVDEKVMSTGTVHESEDNALLDGKTIHYFTRKSPWRDGEGRIIGVIGVSVDVTERDLADETARNMQKIESIGVLAGGIAHDFNNLLGGIFGYLTMAQKSAAADQATMKHLEKALSVFNRAKDLTQRLLTFSSGGSPVRKTGMLEPLIRETAAFALTGSNVSCDFSMREELWPCDFDPSQIEQVVENLVINARQAMPEGGKIAIMASNAEVKRAGFPALADGKYVKVSIVDSGTGIPPEFMRKIFDPFFTTKEKGHGLGLTMCYSIVQKHGGWIQVESELGLGSRFTVYLPASKGAVMEAGGAAPSGHRGSGTVLVMDDEEFMRDIVARMLEEMGYGVLESADGGEAVSVCADAARRGLDVKAAILDLTVPGGMGGKEAIRPLREAFPGLVAFASSGFSSDPVMSDPLEYGFTDSLKKPYRQDELAEVFERHFKGR
jgi:PAS domain S-box-containing protein